MKNGKHKLYIGIDVHSKEHKVALIPVWLLESGGAQWKKLSPLCIKNSIEDFDRLDIAIRSYITSAEEVAVAVDHTGGHYSEPIVHFLSGRGYSVYFLESKGIKAAREHFLDEENKTDTIDSRGAAYMLYLKDVHGLSFRISAIIPELQSTTAAINSLALQRWQFNKLATQATNRLHQFLLAVFPEGEAQCFNQLLKVIPYYPTPRDILDSNGLELVKNLCQEDKERIL